MSELSLLSGVNRTSRLRPSTSEFVPERTFGFGALRALASEFGTDLATAWQAGNSFDSALMLLRNGLFSNISEDPLPCGELF
jgi:hypothetical protein